MSSTPDEREVERLARELCAGEGWNPDERIACEAGDTRWARAEAGGFTCARWEPYADAAAHMLKARQDDWDTF
ncbi:MAG: hypothetical protein JO303_13235 [Caulobacteraceae bacterium]|nr:hypothetical protein [Caulobacteraceae bacterium]